MYVVEYLGEPLTQQKITPGDTVTQLDASTWETMGDRKVAFTSGGTFVVRVGQTVTGHTSTATARVGAVILETGSWAGGDAAGVLYLTNQVGTFQSENLDVGANLNVATIAENTVSISMGLIARACLITVEDNSANITFDGTIPTQTTSTDHGINVPATSSYQIVDPNAIRRFRVIDRTSGSASVIKATCFF